MDDTTRSVIDRITKRYDKPVKLESGHQVSVFFDCVALSPNELARLAAQAIGHFDTESFDVALGLAYEGILFAAAIAGGKSVGILRDDGTVFGPSLKNERVILVSDVVCSGSRLKAAESKLVNSGANVIGYACVIDRSEGKFGTQAKPLWSAYQTSLR